MEKTCIECRETKDSTRFTKTRGGKTPEESYFNKVCKDCEAKARGDRKRVVIEYLLEDTEKAYLAGLLDGEGHIGLYQGGRRKGTTKRRSSGAAFTLKVQITNTNKDVIDWLNTKLNGLSYTSFHDNANNDDPRRNVKKWKDTYQFHVIGRNAEALLLAVQPYCVIKKPQIQIALEYQKTIGYSGADLPGWLIEKRLEIRGRLKALTKRGKPEERA